MNPQQIIKEIREKLDQLEKYLPKTEGMLKKVKSSKVLKTSAYFTKDVFKGKEIYYRDSDMVQGFLKTDEDDLDQLAKQLIKGEHAFSLLQIEELLKKPEEAGLKTDGWATFLPFHTEDGKLFFADVNLFVGTRRWSAFVYRFGHDGVWGAECRVSFRN